MWATASDEARSRGRSRTTASSQHRIVLRRGRHSSGRTGARSRQRTSSPTEVWTPHGLITYYTLFLIDLEDATNPHRWLDAATERVVHGPDEAHATQCGGRPSNGLPARFLRPLSRRSRPLPRSVSARSASSAECRRSDRSRLPPANRCSKRPRPAALGAQGRSPGRGGASWGSHSVVHGPRRARFRAFVGPALHGVTLDQLARAQRYPDEKPREPFFASRHARRGPTP